MVRKHKSMVMDGYPISSALEIALMIQEQHFGVLASLKDLSYVFSLN
jgi:hypothetical protein